MQNIWSDNSKKSILATAVFLTNAPPGTDQQVSAIGKVMLLVIGVVILSISAHVKVPFYPVPMTLQTLVVLLIGMSYGSRLGGVTILSYLFLGAFGAPVFSGGAGFAYLIGPTGGYLLGFFVSTVLLGFLAERGMGKTWKTSALLALIGTSTIYLLGLAWLTSIIGHEKAIQFGFLPFIYGDLLKLVLVSISIPLAWNLVQKITKK
jgi:biotin transport system substrate-specific component